MASVFSRFVGESIPEFGDWLLQQPQWSEVEAEYRTHADPIYCWLIHEADTPTGDAFAVIVAGWRAFRSGLRDNPSTYGDWKNVRSAFAAAWQESVRTIENTAKKGFVPTRLYLAPESDWSLLAQRLLRMNAGQRRAATSRAEKIARWEE